MRRVPDSNYPVRDLFGKGKHGFGPGDKTNGTVATIPGAAFMNAVQEEIANAIEGLGVTLDPDNNSQLLDVLKNRVGARLDSIDALRSFSGGTAVKIVQVAGYYADKQAIGGGVFVADASDKTSSDNGGTVIVSADGTRWRRQADAVSPLDFGARGDGATDDTTYFVSLESAINHATVDLRGKIFKTTKNFSANHYVNGVITTGRNQDHANGRPAAVQTLLGNGHGSLLTMIRTVPDQRAGRAARTILQGAAQDPRTGEFWTIQPYSDVDDGAGGTIEASVLVCYPAAFGGSAELQYKQVSAASADLGHQCIGISYENSRRYFWATGGNIKKDKRQLYAVRLVVDEAGAIDDVTYYKLYKDDLYNGDGNNCIAVSPDGQFLASTCKYNDTNMWICRVWRVSDLSASADNTDNWLYEMPLRSHGLPVQAIAMDGNYVYVLHGGSSTAANVYSVFTITGDHVADYTDNETGRDLMQSLAKNGYDTYYEPEAFAIANVGGQMILTQWVMLGKKSNHHACAVYSMRPLLGSVATKPTTYIGDAAVVPKQFTVRAGTPGDDKQVFSAGTDTNSFGRVHNKDDYMGLTVVNNDATNRRFSVFTHSVKNSAGGNITFYSLLDGGGSENSGVLRLAGAASESYLDVGKLAVYPSHTGKASLGTASKLWTQVFAETATIGTSDERYKCDISGIHAAVIDAWRKVDWQQYRWVDAVDEKGAGARYHTGLIAQRVRDAFDTPELRALGINAQDYGLLCYDQWPELPAQEAVLDEDGNIIEPAAEYRPAGERWGVRMDECLAMEAESQRRLIADLSRRIEALESK